ncbi:MAG: 4-(cytidine 5'-diphospho)-2-C-methyl-D-erythritol kinase, partial [Desulfitobacterium sp.]|nr:4-(cytidine 5'-diphospho)-2-C-methyl-D-erythritol kinase [Desulfitobacterium sp.]
MSQSHLELFAYAKINLALAITGRREDGYHELESIMQSIGIYDFVRLTLQREEIECYCGEFSGPENLAFKAAQRFFRDLNTSQGVKIEIQKAIPVQGGLGGGSADAAATLLGLNNLLGNPYTIEELEKFASELGADVAFCLRGGTQWAAGVGERLRKLPKAPKLYFVIVKPPQGVDTALAYRTFDEEGKTSHLDYLQWEKALASG